MMMVEILVLELDGLNKVVFMKDLTYVVTGVW